VRGLARRKGEANPFKWGFDIDDSLLSHPKWKNAPDLPPLKTPKKPKVKKEKGRGLIGKLGGFFEKGEKKKKEDGE